MRSGGSRPDLVVFCSSWASYNRNSMLKDDDEARSCISTRQVSWNLALKPLMSPPGGRAAAKITNECLTIAAHFKACRMRTGSIRAPDKKRSVKKSSMAPINDVRALARSRLILGSFGARAARGVIRSDLVGFCSSWAVCDRDQPYSSGRESQLW